MRTLHVYPVPHGMTPEEAWEEIEVMGHLVEYSRWNWRYWPGFRSWAVMPKESE